MIAQGFVWTARLVLGAEARWIGCQPSAAQRIYVANHTSHADFVVLWSALPRELRNQTHPVAASDYWKRNRLRQYMAEHIFGSLLVERQRFGHANNPLQTMLTAIGLGKSLIVFPEGTRGVASEPGDFKCGIYHLARHCPEVEIVPVRIANLHRALPKGALVPVPMLCSVTFGSPTRLVHGEEKSVFLTRLRRAVIEAGNHVHP